MSAAIEAAVIAAMLAGAGTAAEIRAASGLSAADVKAGVQRARFKGKILFDRLELAPSMRAQAEQSYPVAVASEPQGQTGEADEESASGKGGGAVVSSAPPPVSDEIVSPGPAPLNPPGGGGGIAPGDEGGAAPSDAASPVNSVTGEALCAEVESWLKATGTLTARFTLGCGNNKAYLHGLRKVANPTAKTIKKVRDFLAAHPEGIKSPARVAPSSETQKAKHRIEAPRAPAAASVAETVRVEAEQAGARRRVAQSTGSVATVLPKAEPEVRRTRSSDVAGRAYHAPMQAPAAGRARRRIALPSDLSPVETIQTMLAEDPRDLIRAIARTHDALWRRCILLGRARGEPPAAAMYAALERGIAAIEAEAPAMAEGGR